tara:strand:+ start:1390 stop:1569 length:180 start_codon:yes stop_codon:yes gene_type:complete
MQNRFKTAQNERNDLDIKFERVVQPKCLFVSDISEDPLDWKNQAYNLYFRKDFVKIYKK